MTNPLSSVLAKVFRDRTRSTSLRELRREGHHQVQVLDFAELEEIVARALESALAESAIPPETVRELAASAGLEVAHMMGQKEGLERTTQQLERQRAALEDNVQQIQDALEESRSALDEASVAGDRDHSAVLRDRLDKAWITTFEQSRVRWRESGEACEAVEQLRDPLRDATLNALIGLSFANDDSEEGQDLGLLQRRVSKLSASLVEAHQMLDRLRDGRGEQEQGIASVHSRVQGLSRTEPDYDRRKGLLREVFQLNLDLRGDLGNEASG